MDSNQLQLIKRLGLFSVFAFVFYFVMICFWGNYAPKEFKKNLNFKKGSNGHMFTRIQEIKTVKEVDILFLGSSHAYRGFDPRFYTAKGLRTFNLGSSAQTPLQTKLLLNKYLDEINPTFIIFEVNPYIFENQGIESALDLIANDKKDAEIIKMTLELKHIKVFNTLLYAYYYENTARAKEFKEAKVRGSDTYVKGGFVQKKLQYYSEPRHFEKTKLNFLPNQIKAFQKICSKLKKQNIPYILVQAPITKSRYTTYTNSNEFDELMKEQGIYYNFNLHSKLIDSLDFYDNHHLNENGVRKFNEQLFDTLLMRHEINKN